MERSARALALLVCEQRCLGVPAGREVRSATRRGRAQDTHGHGHAHHLVADELGVMASADGHIALSAI